MTQFDYPGFILKYLRLKSKPRKIVPAKKGKNSKKQLGFVKSQLKSLSQSDILDTINEIEDIEIFEELKTKDPSNKANSKLVSMLEKYCKEILDRIDSPSSFEDQEDEEDINQQISSYKNSLNMSFLKLTFNCLGLADFTFQLKAEHLEHRKLAKFLKEEIYDNEEFLNFNLKIPFLYPLKPENRQFINNFKIFWKIIFNQTDLINDEIHLLQHIQEWMVIFSESRLRPVRQGSIEMAKIFLDLGKEFLKENLIKQEKEKDAEQRKEIVLNMKLIESLCNELFDIMTNRLKDVCEKIREKAARSFFDTILAFPEKFVTIEIFEDAQFLLKDKNDEINIIALDFAQKITKLLYQRAQNQIKQQGNLNENEEENSVLEEQSEDLKTIIHFYSQQSTRRLIYTKIFSQDKQLTNLALEIYINLEFKNNFLQEDFKEDDFSHQNNQDLSCHILTSFLNLINKIKPNILNQNNHQQQIDNLTEVLFHHTSAIYDYNSVFALLEQEDNDKNSSFKVKKFENFDLLLLMIAESSAKYAQQIIEGHKNLPKIELEKYNKIIPSFSLSLIKNTQPLLQKYLQIEQNLNLNESEYGNKDAVKKLKQENQLKITGLLSLYQYVEESQINDSDFSEILKIILKLLDDLFIATENPQTIENIGKIINTYQKKINKSNHKILLQKMIDEMQKLQLDNVPKNVENNVLTQLTKLCSHSTLFSYSILVQDIIRDFIIQHIQQQKIIEDNSYLINLLKQLKQKEVQPENEKQLIFWHLIEKLMSKFIEEDENLKAADELNKLVVKLYFTQRERVQKYQETAKSKFLTFLISMINIQLDLQQDDITGAYNEQNFEIFKYLEVLLDTCKPQKSGYIQPKNLKYLFVLLDQKINQNKEERAEKNLKEINEIQGFKHLQSFHQHLMKINGFKLQNSEEEKQDAENKQNTDKMLEENDNEQKEEEIDQSSKKRKSSKIKDLNLNLYSDTKDTDDEQEKNERRQTRQNQSKNKMLEESQSENLDNKEDQQYQQYDADLLDSTNNQIKKQNKKTKTKKQDIQIESDNDMSDESGLFSDDENTKQKNLKKNQQKIRPLQDQYKLKFPLKSESSIKITPYNNIMHAAKLPIDFKGNKFSINLNYIAKIESQKIKIHSLSNTDIICTIDQNSDEQIQDIVFLQNSDFLASINNKGRFQIHSVIFENGNQIGTQLLIEQQFPQIENEKQLNIYWKDQQNLAIASQNKFIKVILPEINYEQLQQPQEFNLVEFQQNITQIAFSERYSLVFIVTDYKFIKVYNYQQMKEIDLEKLMEEDQKIAKLVDFSLDNTKSLLNGVIETQSMQYVLNFHISDKFIQNSPQYEQEKKSYNFFDKFKRYNFKCRQVLEQIQGIVIQTEKIFDTQYLQSHGIIYQSQNNIKSDYKLKTQSLLLLFIYNQKNIQLFTLNDLLPSDQILVDEKNHIQSVFNLNQDKEQISDNISEKSPSQIQNTQVEKNQQINGEKIPNIEQKTESQQSFPEFKQQKISSSKKNDQESQKQEQNTVVVQENENENMQNQQFKPKNFNEQNPFLSQFVNAEKEKVANENSKKDVDQDVKKNQTSVKKNEEPEFLKQYDNQIDVKNAVPPIEPKQINNNLKQDATKKKQQSNIKESKQITGNPVQIPDIQSHLENRMSIFLQNIDQHINKKFDNLEGYIENKVQQKLQLGHKQSIDNVVKQQIQQSIKQEFGIQFQSQVTPCFEQYLQEIFKETKNTFEKGITFYNQKVQLEKEKNETIHQSTKNLQENINKLITTGESISLNIDQSAKNLEDMQKVIVDKKSDLEQNKKHIENSQKKIEETQTQLQIFLKQQNQILDQLQKLQKNQQEILQMQQNLQRNNIDQEDDDQDRGYEEDDDEDEDIKDIAEIQKQIGQQQQPSLNNSILSGISMHQTPQQYPQAQQQQQQQYPTYYNPPPNLQQQYPPPQFYQQQLPPNQQYMQPYYNMPQQNYTPQQQQNIYQAGQNYQNQNKKKKKNNNPNNTSKNFQNKY
ncbi:WD40-repeat-containing domain [Pseudocohnilembus persalinus]|uniref:WD40-repeat-containing domain n=1 Tax=Pseudocohnilembus persalinus TaxID=266149 RepID=A0A0V0QH84_PSEPJ|nr:WD40-repeat-containing domain [Pseudocohnilembus persalinus]|eukprot:KRX01456.1 WD40-repeat-containing domain [Pseudocohnilembus persalinus]